MPMRPLRTTCLLVPSLCIALLQPALPLLAAPETCQSGSPAVCPEWLPSQAEVSETVEAYFRSLAKQGALQLQIGPVIYTSTSTVSCVALDSSADSNFICGGALTFWDVLGRKQILQFSPTLRYTENGGIAIYELGKWVEPEI